MAVVSLPFYVLSEKMYLYTSRVPSLQVVVCLFVIPFAKISHTKTHIYIYIYIYIYTFVFQIYIHKCMFVYIYIYIYLYVFSFVQGVLQVGPILRKIGPLI